MIWKYIVAGFVLFGFVYSYPIIKQQFGLTLGYNVVVVVAFVVLGFVLTPLYWKANVKKAEKEKASKKVANQPWE